jgi:pimeloyl-ACP methyl ester carboxylesterase
MQKTFSYNGSIISYRVEGTGKPVVLLHGFGEDSNIFNHQINFLQQHCLLIIPDIPGSGKSEMLQVTSYKKPVTSNQHPATFISIDDYAKCIHALLQHENISQYILLGHSMGGYITLAFAEMFPQLLTAFGFIHSTAFADSEEKKQNRQRGIELIEEYGSYSFLKTTSPNLFSKQYKEAFPKKVASLIEEGKQFSKKALQQYYTAMMNRPDRTNVLKSNPLPVLFVIGKEDVAAPLNDLLQQIHLPQYSYIYILENVGHMSMWEATEKLNTYLLNFISST